MRMGRLLCSTRSAGTISATVRFSLRAYFHLLIHRHAVIYIDQPIGTGFSHGTVDVNSTFNAAPEFWSAFQVLFESGEFSRFRRREYVLRLPVIVRI